MKTKAIEQERVGLMLACGLSKKEIAAQTGKSINTVSKQSDNIYKLSNSRNLADITRWMVSRYTGIPVEDVLIHAMHDITVLAAASFLTWCAMQPEVAEKINLAITAITEIF